MRTIKSDALGSKGQQISKQNCPAVTSPKKRTQDSTDRVRFVRFLGEVIPQQFCFEIN